jgi:hypothetical protein
MTEGAKPAVSAFLCERVLTEKDGVQTYVRVVDIFSAKITPGARARLQAWLIIILRSADAKGDYTVTVRMNSPIGKITPMGEGMPAQMKGGEHGISFNVLMIIDVEHEGVYTIDVLLDGEVVTRVPFKVRLETVLPEPEHPTQSAPDQAQPFEQ